jgi:hypothetical protein
MPTNRERATLNFTAEEIADLEPHWEALRLELEREKLSFAAFIHASLSRHYGLNWPVPGHGGARVKTEEPAKPAKKKAGKKAR